MTALPMAVASLPLGDKAEVRITLDTFNGKARLDIRTWADYSAGPVQTRGPTKKGVSLPIADLPALALAMRTAETAARQLGLIGDRDAETE